jgi:hypothetical protein
MRILRPRRRFASQRAAGGAWPPSNSGEVHAISVPNGQGLKQIGELGLAFGLCSLIGLQREWRMKSALGDLQGVHEVAATGLADVGD